LKNVTPKLPVAALLLALGCMGIIWLMRLKDPIVTKTFAIANANRHVGLALLLTGRYTHSMRALPAIACYALVVVLVMIAYGMWFRGGERKQELSASEAESSIASS
jgi:hypothetical protein